MKKNEIMKENITNKFFFFLFSLFLFALLACENPIEQPFKVGLGPVVDTQPPTVTLRDPCAGDFIWGDKAFTGFAEDDYKLEKVEMKVTNYKGLRDGVTEDEWKNYQPVMLTLEHQNKGKWFRKFDTTLYKDGDLKIKLRVTDSTKKITETEEISFYINNDRPAIMVMMPPVISIDDPDKIKPGMVGGQSKNSSLNYEVSANAIPYQPNLDPITKRPYGRDYPRAMEKDSSLSGSISDAQDIYTGPRTAEGRYPPQIRFWRIRDENEEPTFNPSDPAWLPGEFPTLAQVDWHDLRADIGEFFPAGKIGSYQFKYDLPPEINRYYGFEVRVQNKDGRSSFHYPRDCYSDGPGTDWADGDHKFNRYVLIYVRPQREAPEVGIYGLEDVFEYWRLGGGNIPYPKLQDEHGVELNEHRYHPYVDSLTTINKNGKGFILRVKAKHSDDIGFAAVYWTKEGTNECGRFIWDTAEASHETTLPFKITPIDPSNPFSEWGYRDPQLGIDARVTRSFFFTYNNDPARDSIPNDSRYHPDVRGKSKLQKLAGSVTPEAWREIKKGSPAADLWTDMRTLEDGVYNLDIYVRSRSGTVPQSISCSVRLDTKAPKVEVSDVEGNYMRIDSTSSVKYIVNGVIQPNLLFNDDGSGPRTATVETSPPSKNYFWNPNTSKNGYEQLYVLVSYSDGRALQQDLDRGIKDKYWWPVNDSVTGLDAGAVTAIRDGRVPLDGGKFRFRLKTSYVNSPYNVVPPVEADALDDTPDDEPYYLYVFCRDGAFNVGHAFVTLDVKAKTDLPEIDFSAGAIKEVTDPNVSADHNSNNTGFYDAEGNLRNKLTPGSPIRLFIKDDDSLDLGLAGGDASQVQIRVAKAQYAGDGTISAGPFAALSDSQIKSIFPPQVLDAGVRRAVKSIQGGSAIPQQTLVSALGGTGANLPDGMYNLEISVGDYNVDPVKMKMPTDPSSSPVRAVSPTKNFWVVVDTTPPQYTPDTKADGSFEPEDYVDNGFITGTVEDANGPVKILSAKVYEVVNGADREVSEITFNKIGDPGPNTSSTNWKGKFKAEVGMNGRSGRYRFDIIFVDRFLNPKTLSMWLSADNVPPKALIGTEISTFKRDYADPLDGLSGVSSENRQRLANGVLTFTISASDFIDSAGTTPGKIKSVKWWLVSGDNPTAPTPAQYRGETAYASAKNGSLTENFNAPQYIDTRTAPVDGVYTLIVMAEDNAGNISTPSAASKQTIYLLQDHDKPYFGYSTTGNLPLTIEPADNKVTKSSLVTGKIYDDDGFYDDNNNLLPGSVTIWMSTDPSAGSQSESADPSNSNGYGTEVAVSGLSRAAKIDGNSVINLKDDLKTLFPGPMSTDGPKWYIIGAQDSHLNKINPDGTKPAAAERRMRYKKFSFTYDTKAPVIVLTNHHNNAVKTFGPNANIDGGSYDDVNFRLAGTITEANPKKNGPDGTTGDYYIEYYLDSNSQNPKPLALTNGVNGITANYAGEVLTFTVPAAFFCNTSNLDFGGITNGAHSITFIAYDRSDQKGTYTFNFIKDEDKPALAFTSPAEPTPSNIRLPKVTFPVSGGTLQEWWWTPTDSGQRPAWYQARHTVLGTQENSNALPVITYARGNTTPQLKVTFTDPTSNIDAGSLKYWIDNESTARAAPNPGVTSRSVSWTIELVTAGVNPVALSDGVHSIRFEIKDAVGNELLSSDTNGTIYYGFRINSGPPAITATPPVEKVYGGTATPLFNITNIKATGPNLKNVQLVIRYLGNNSSTTADLPIAPAANGGSWSFNVVINDGIATTNDEILTWSAYPIPALPASATSGEYQLELRARGLDNRLSDPYIWTFTVDKVQAVPSITDFPTNAASTDNLRPNYWASLSGTTANRKVFTTSTQRIQGLISDAHSDLKTAKILIQRFNYAANAWGNYYTIATGDWNSATAVWNDLLGADKTREKTVSLQLGDIQNITNGFYRVRLQATDSAYIDSGTGDGNPVESSYYYFFYAPDNPKIVLNEDDNKPYSARAEGGTVKFKNVTVKSADESAGNGYQWLEVQIKNKDGSNVGSAISQTWGPLPAAGTASSWNAGWTIPEITLSPLTKTTPDGSYQLVFTVTDWAGKSSSESRTITLDNTPPSGGFTGPELMPEGVRNSNARYAQGSETFYGGEASLIEGTADDSKGLAGIWYHLGFTQEAALSDPQSLPSQLDVIRTVLPGAATTDDDLGGKANNDAFDAAAQNSTSASRAWFKYTDDVAYPRPNGFDAPATPLNLYTWKLNIPQSGDLSKKYAELITLKGRNYNQTSGPTLRLAQQLMEASDPNPLPLAYQKSNGLYCMPVWVRVSDEAGNVTYFNQNIWLYPKGDYPTIAIESPDRRIDTEQRSRGGTVLFDGIASDNVNVKSVIYRIRADNKRENTPGWNSDAPSDESHYVIPSGATMLKAGDPEWATFIGTQGLAGVNTTGWFRASLEGADSLAKGKSWSFYVNANDEFNTEWTMSNGTRVKPIRDWGFRSLSTLQDPDMIRVYVEILAFDGADKDHYHLMSLGDNNAGLQAKPDVVIFYLSETSPKITDLKLSDVGTIGRNDPNLNNATYSKYEGLRTRSGKFAVQMTFNSGSTQKNIEKVQVRLPNEAAGGNPALAIWREVWEKGSNKNIDGVSFSSSGMQSFTMTYAFNTLTGTPNAFSSVMRTGATSNWAASGGKYTIEVRLYDNSTPPRETSQTFEIGVDNFAPVEDRMVITNPKVAGSSQAFMGRAFDYTQPENGSPSPGYYGINRVYAWFTRNSNGASDSGYVNMNNKNDNTNPTTSIIQAYVNRTADFKYQAVNSETVTGITLTNTGSGPAPRSYPTPAAGDKSNDYVKVISEAEANNLANNMYWSDIIAGRSIQWSFMLDTNNLDDGPIYLNYIVVDNAGNASLFQQRLVVMNNYPIINGLTLYTDNTGQGAVFTKDASQSYSIPASMPDGYLNSGFISKNKYIGFRVETAKGNGDMHYRVQYVTREKIELNHDNLVAIAADAALTSGRTWSNIYTIAEKGGMGDAIWADLMGRPKVTAEKGTHFAFLMSPNDISVNMNYTGTWVYQYTVVSDLTKNKTKSGTVRSFVDDKEYTASDDLGFRFFGNDFGTGASKITEMNGSHPPEEQSTTPNNPAETALFLIKVYDSVDGNAAEDDQLYDALVVGMNVYLNDTKAPFARLYDLNPYTETAVTGNNVGESDKPKQSGGYWTNAELTMLNAMDPVAVGSNIVRGGLYNTNTEREPRKSGYIEPRRGSSALEPKNSVYVNGSPPTQTAGGLPDSGYPLLADDAEVLDVGADKDKVSGKIILRGVAWDDQLISEIKITIGTDPQKTILSLASNNQMVAENNAPASARETLHWKTGHTVEWAYIWDTETEPADANGGPRENVAVTVQVKDRNGNHVNIPVSSGDFHNQITVDIVPYITGFQREKPKFETKRSLQGWYSFYQGEENISLLGYNFGRDRANVAITLYDGTSSYTLSNPGSYGTTVKPFRFNIPGTAHSGKIEVMVNNSTKAYNHDSNHEDRSWNRENSSYTPGSDLWINKPYAHIWRSIQDNAAPRTYIGRATSTGNGFANATSEGLDHPGMALEYQGANAGRLHGTWSVYAFATSFYGTNNSADTPNRIATDTANAESGEPFATPDISIYQGGGAAAANIGYSYQRDGTSRTLVKANVTTTTTTAVGNNDSATYPNIMQPYTDPTSTQRWQNLRISKQAGNFNNTEANVGRIYMTAFDSQNKSLWYGTRGGTAANNHATNTIFIDGGNATNGVGGLGVVGSAGQYSAVDYDSTGPIIAYYDQTNDTVRIALGTTIAATAANQFTRNYLLPRTGGGSELSRGSGKYISIKVDSAGHIHLAFYNSVYNTVVYYYADSRSSITQNGTAPNGTTVKCHTIDNVVTGGTWTDISVDENGNPWIVYGDSSRTGNYDGVRIAYRSSATTGEPFTGELTCPITGADIKGWEALTMPADYTVNNDRLNIEVWPPTHPGTVTLGNAPGWNAAIGYASSLFRVAYFYYPNYKGY